MKLISSLSILIIAGSVFIAPAMAASTIRALPSARKISVPVSGRLVSYAGGWCGLHLTQQQKPDPSRDSYRIRVRLFDQNQAEIGAINDVNAPTNQGIGITSQLPYVLIATTGPVDASPVSFRYADQSWDSNSSQCSVGGYDSGKREMDCGFSC